VQKDTCVEIASLVRVHRTHTHTHTHTRVDLIPSCLECVGCINAPEPFWMNMSGGGLGPAGCWITHKGLETWARMAKERSTHKTQVGSVLGPPWLEGLSCPCS
jgi:hypothetical protein